MAIEIQGRDAQERKTTPLTVGITTRNNAILEVIAKQIGERKGYVVNKLVAEIKLTKEAVDEVNQILADAEAQKAERPKAPTAKAALRPVAQAG